MKKKTKKKTTNNKKPLAQFYLLPWQKPGGLKFKFAVFVLFAILGTIIYSNTFYSPFQFDDTLQILTLDRVKDLSHFTSFKAWSNVSNRPVSFLTFALNYRFGEYNVFGYHLINLLIHFISTFFVFLLIRQIFLTPAMKENRVTTFRDLFAFFTALLFLAHPVQTQAVTYIVQRMTSLSALFYLASVYFYASARLSYLKGNSIRKTILWFALAGIAAIASLLSKQIAVTLPFIFLLYEICFIRDKNGKLFKKYVIAIGAILAAIVTIVLAGGYLPAETTKISRLHYLFTQFRVLVKYLQLFILPVNQNLDYDFAVSTSFFNLKVILSLILLIVVAITGILIYKKHRLVTFGIFWFFITLAVESSIIPIRDVIFEHRLYLPMTGLAMIVVYLAWYYIGRINFRVAVILLSGLALVYSVATFARNEKWRSQYSIWKDVTSKSPEKPRPWYNLGKISLDDGRYNESINYLRKSLEIDPDQANAWYNVGLDLERLNEKEKAKQFFEKAIAVDSTHFASYNNLGNIYMKSGNYKKAAEILAKANKLKPDQYPILQNLGIAYYYLGEYDKAIKINRRQLRLKPDAALIYTSLGKAYVQEKKYENAIEAFQKALELNPKLTTILTDIGICYYGMQKYDEAVNTLQEALSHEPGNNLAKQYLDMARQQNGRE